MGEVYHAEHVRTGGEFAVKLLPEHLARDPHAKARLRNEALAASKLRNRHICTVHDVDEDDGVLFVVMELYDGGTLAETLEKRGSLPVAEAVEIARQVADGLGDAHRAGIVHRDVKPSNVFLCKVAEGRAPHAVILDFGVAKVAGVDLTQAGGTVGTVAYAAPEQARDRAVDGRADLWALGVVLYEMLAGPGRRPFMALHDAALLHAIQFESPEPLRAHRPEVPEALEAMVMRLLAKEPADRFETAEAAEAALAVTSEGRAPARPRRRRPRWLVPVAAAALLFVFILAFVFRGVSSAGPPLPEERHIAVLPFTVAADDTDGRVFADGLVEVMVSELAQLERYEGALQVVPTSEVRAQEIESASQARSAVGATLVVTGRVVRDSARVEVTLSLEDATSLRHLDGATLRQPRASLDALRRDVVAALARMLDVELQPEARAALVAGGTRSSAAFEAYVRGLGLLEGATPDALDQAVEAFETAVREDPGFVQAHARLGEAALRAYEETREPARVRQAEAAVERAVALAPGESLGYVVRARLYTTTGRYDAAVREARRALELDPASDAAYDALAKAYDAGGDAAAAEAAYREAIDRRPGDWQSHNSLGKFYFEQGRFEDALQAWQRVTQLKPDLARGYNNLGAANRLLGRPDSARAMYERAVALYPTYAPLSNLASLYYDEGRYTDAIRTYLRALDLEDHDHTVWGSLAAAYERQENRNLAIPAYREAIRRAESDHDVNPSAPLPLVHLANYYVSLGDSTRAREDAAAAAGLSPEGEDALYLGMAFEQLGEREEALRWIERALTGGVPEREVESTPALAALIADPGYQAYSTDGR